MDSYTPVLDSVRPSLSVMADDRPWAIKAPTQTIFWLAAPAPRRGVASSSHPQHAGTFVVINEPGHAGLQRLRKFAGWKDNWDAEGGKAPSRTVLDTATQVYSLLVSYAVPAVDLSPNGLPIFLYDGPIQGEIQITSENTLDYYFTSGGPSDEDVVFDGKSLPLELLHYLRS